MATKFDFNAPLYCNAYIAAGISAEAGIVYERLRWMVQDCKGKKTEFGTVHDDGRRWVDFTYAQLYEYLPIFKSVKALRDVMAKLEKAGLIESKSLPRAKWYTISDLDPATLTKIVTVPCQNSSAYPDENRHPIMTKIVTHADENRHPPYNKESESTPKQQSETDTESFYSSDQPQPVPVEEKEKSILHFPVFEDELISKLAYVLGYSLQGSPKLVKETKVTLAGIARELRTIDPAVKANDLARYLEYYHLQAPSRPRPAVRYVLKGWQGYKDWLGGQAPTYDDTEIGGTIQVGDEWVYVFALPKDWQAIENGVPSGWVLDCISDETRQRVHYTQQPDGTFALTEVAREAS